MSQVYKDSGDRPMMTLTEHGSEADEDGRQAGPLQVHGAAGTLVVQQSKEIMGESRHEIGGYGK